MTWFMTSCRWVPWFWNAKSTFWFWNAKHRPIAVFAWMNFEQCLGFRFGKMGPASASHHTGLSLELSEQNFWLFRESYTEVWQIMSPLISTLMSKFSKKMFKFSQIHFWNHKSRADNSSDGFCENGDPFLSEMWTLTFNSGTPPPMLPWIPWINFGKGSKTRVTGIARKGEVPPLSANLFSVRF